MGTTRTRRTSEGMLGSPRTQHKNRRDGAVRIKNALVGLNELTTAVVRFVSIPYGSEPRAPKGT
jgi:hypothetical protein